MARRQGRVDVDIGARLSRRPRANLRLRRDPRGRNAGIREELAQKMTEPVREDIIVSLAVAMYIATVFKLIELAFE
jgi:hypothetical protein